MSEAEIIAQMRELAYPGRFDYELSQHIGRLEHAEQSWDEAEDLLQELSKNDPRRPVLKHALDRFREAAERLYEVL